MRILEKSRMRDCRLPVRHFPECPQGFSLAQAPFYILVLTSITIHHFNSHRYSIVSEQYGSEPKQLRSFYTTFPCYSAGRGRRHTSKCIRVMASNDRDNLDHLQRVNRQQQQRPKRTIAPVGPVGLWDRFPTARTVQQMMETMERLIEDPFLYSSGWPSPLPGETGSYSRGRTPWEIKEGEGEYKMRFDVPGMTKEDVKVWVEEKMLFVKAEKVPERKTGEGNNGEVEEGEEEWPAKSYGRYNSRIALPENVEFEKITAGVKDGVLYISIPKAASTTSKILDINMQ